jgi:pimeloyl-ACP methyl ester carboxylesterase
VRLEVARHGPSPDAGPALVLLHEGLGCVGMWRDWPARLARETGRGVLVYSRAGYGASDPVPLPRPLDYMQREGEDALPLLLDAAGVREALLVGHSDGGSIALVHAATAADPARVRGLALLAPHVFCEEVSVRSIAAAREEYLHGDLRERLARYHGPNVDVAFWGWNRAWLDPAFFRNFDLRAYLPRVRVPTLVIQGDADAYGTLAQVEAIVGGVSGPSARFIFPGAGHTPHRDRPDETTRAIVEFASQVLG